MMKKLNSTALAACALVIGLSVTPSEAHAGWGNWSWSSWNWGNWWSNFKPYKPQNKPTVVITSNKPQNTAVPKPTVVVASNKPQVNAPEPIIGLLAAGAAGTGGVMMRRRSKKKKAQA
ncbi:MAG TPA: hypothetical protein EYH06_01070 [Chromatiales bacterium]|nr:hypothetical protein [Chromatiales bacterium]